MKKIVFVAGSFFFTTLGFGQQQSQQPPQQIQNRFSNLTNILIQNVINTNFNNNDNNNNVQVVSNPRPRQRINRPNRRYISANNSTNKTPVIAQRRIARKPPRRLVTRTTNTLTINPVVNLNPSLGNGESKSTQNIINNIDVQTQNFVSNVSKNPQVQSDNGNGNSHLNLNIDFSFNVKTASTVKTTSSYAGSSARYKSRTFIKKFAKFKRNFFGKITAHKKSKRHTDICFNWKS
jgi:hypothetical protein